MGVLPRTLGQNDPRNNLLVLNTLSLLWSFQEWHLQNKALSTLLCPSCEILQLSVPADLEVVVPASENGISGLQLEVRFPSAGSESRSRDITNVIDKVCIQASCHERELQLLQRARWRVVVAALLVRNPREVVLQTRGTVC